MKASVTISRASDDVVRIRIREENSRIEFAVVSMTAEQFAYAITGLAECEAGLEVVGLEHVGKVRITEPRVIECPLDTYEKEQLQQWLRENAQEEGWLLSAYLGSKSSVSRRDGKTLLRYSVTKYVDQQSL